MVGETRDTRCQDVARTNDQEGCPARAVRVVRLDQIPDTVAEQIEGEPLLVDLVKAV